MVKYVKGNLLDSDCDYICHQVNCQGRMRSGIAKQIRERWPMVYQKYEYNCEVFSPEELLGSFDMVNVEDDRIVVNIYGQLNYGYDGKRYTDYKAFRRALTIFSYLPAKGATIGFPKNIGCGLGGGDWEVISSIIEETLGKDFNVYIYELED